MRSQSHYFKLSLSLLKELSARELPPIELPRLLRRHSRQVKARTSLQVIDPDGRRSRSHQFTLTVVSPTPIRPSRVESKGWRILVVLTILDKRFRS